jgi:membrane-associated protein
MFDLTSIVETGGYIGLFAIIFAESGLLIGFFLPGDSLLFTAGFLSSQGFMNIWILVPLLFVAAVAGDAVGYLFGKKFGPRVFNKEESFFFHPRHVDRTSQFFEKHGTKTIMLARFIPVVRTFAPIMAGVGGMKYATFARYNVIGALIWAVGMTLLGYIFGQTVPDAEKYVVPIVIVIILTSFIPPAIEYFKNRRNKNSISS